MPLFGRLVACGSTALSIAVLFAGPLVPLLGQASQLRAGLSWLANVARKTDVSCVDPDPSPPDSIKVLEWKTGQAMAILEPEIGGGDPIGTIISTSADDAKPYPEKSWSAPIDWLFDKPGSRAMLTLSNFGNGVRIIGFSIGGTNASDQPLTEVRAILKPDKGSRDIELILSLGGDHQSRESSRTIPPGARFSLVYAFPGHSNGMPTSAFLAKFGGAVFAFKYTHAGSRRTLISYLSESKIKEQLPTAEARRCPDSGCL